MATVNQIFDIFLITIKKRKAKDYKDVGGYELNYDGNGYIIYKIANKNGGLSEPFGNTRLKRSNFISHLRFAMDSLVIYKAK